MIANHQTSCLSASISLNDASRYLVERLTFTRFTRCLTLSVGEDAWRQLPAEKSESFAAKGNYNPGLDNDRTFQLTLRLISFDEQDSAASLRQRHIGGVLFTQIGASGVDGTNLMCHPQPKFPSWRDC